MAAGVRKTTNHPFSASEAESFIENAVGGKVATWKAGANCFVGDLVFLQADGKVDPAASAANATLAVGIVVGGEALGEYNDCVDEAITYQELLAGADGQLIIVLNLGVAYAIANEAIAIGARVTGAAGGRVADTGVAAGNIAGLCLTTAAAQDDVIKIFVNMR